MSIKQARISLESYVQSSGQGELLQAVKREGVANQETAAAFNLKVRKKTKNIQEWKEKPLYGQFPSQTEDQKNEFMHLFERRDVPIPNRPKLARLSILLCLTPNNFTRQWGTPGSQWVEREVGLPVTF